jgi:general secretion pathway protein K
MKCTHPVFRRRGSSLLLVLWAIMLMSFSVIGLVEHLSRGLDESIQAEKQFRARLLLQSARVLAGHPAIERGDPLLRQQMSHTAAYDIVLTTEGVCLAVNQLGTSRLQRSFAARLFESKGLDASQARTLADSIGDWIDGDDKPRTQGAERDFYLALGRSDFPYNQPFSSIDDLLLVRDFSSLERLWPDWRNSFTLLGDGTIDLQLAPQELLAVLFDVTPSEVGRFVQARLGPDNIPDTVDDPVFTTMKEVRALLDVPQANFRKAEPLLTLSHPIRRTECLATVGGLERRLTIINGPGLFFIREE